MARIQETIEGVLLRGETWECVEGGKPQYIIGGGSIACGLPRERDLLLSVEWRRVPPEPRTFTQAVERMDALERGQRRASWPPDSVLAVRNRRICWFPPVQMLTPQDVAATDWEDA